MLYADLNKELEKLSSQNASSENDSSEAQYALAVDILDQTIDIKEIENMPQAIKYHSAKLAGNCLGDLIYSKYETLGKFWITEMIESP